MGLYDFNINDSEPEHKKLYDVSADKGKTWKKQYLTPTEILQHKMAGYVIRSGFSDKTIALYPGMSATPVVMTISIPADRDAEEYIDEYLDGLLSDFVRYNCEWEFI